MFFALKHIIEAAMFCVGCFSGLFSSVLVESSVKVKDVTVTEPRASDITLSGGAQMHYSYDAVYRF